MHSPQAALDRVKPLPEAAGGSLHIFIKTPLQSPVVVLLVIGQECQLPKFQKRLLNLAFDEMPAGRLLEVISKGLFPVTTLEFLTGIDQGAAPPEQSYPLRERR